MKINDYSFYSNLLSKDSKWSMSGSGLKICFENPDKTVKIDVSLFMSNDPQKKWRITDIRYSTADFDKSKLVTSNNFSLEQYAVLAKITADLGPHFYEGPKGNIYIKSQRDVRAERQISNSEPRSEDENQKENS